MKEKQNKKKWALKQKELLNLFNKLSDTWSNHNENENVNDETLMSSDKNDDDETMS